MPTGERRSACGRCFSLLPDAPAPVPISASWSLVGDSLFVQCDLPLQDGPINPANWSASHGGTEWVGGPGAQVVAGAIAVPMVDTGLPIGGESCCYNAVPPDVVGVNGTPVAAFCDYPLTPL